MNNCKNLLFIASVPNQEQSGISVKVALQVAALSELGFCVKVLRPNHSGWRRAIICLSSLKELLSIRDRSRRAYVRYDAYTAPVLLICKLFGVASIAELNGDLQAEVRLKKSGWRVLVQTACDNLALRCANVCTGASRDVVRKYQHVARRTVVVPNATDIPGDVELPQKRCNPYSEYPIRLLYVGGFSPAHGLDLLLEAMSTSPQSGTELLLVGDGPERKCIEKFVMNLPIKRNVKFLGWLDQEEIRNIAASSHVGIGPLAMERVGLTNGSPLKVREYLSMGLPVVIGYDEEGVLANTNFIARVRTDSPRLLANDILQFADEIVLPGGHILRQEISEFARVNLSYSRWAQVVIEELLGAMDKGWRRI